MEYFWISLFHNSHFAYILAAERNFSFNPADVFLIKRSTTHTLNAKDIFLVPQTERLFVMY